MPEIQPHRKKSRILAKHHWHVLALDGSLLFFCSFTSRFTRYFPSRFLDTYTYQSKPSVVSRAAPSLALEVIIFFLYHKNKDFLKSVFSALSTTFMILSGKRHDLILRMPNCACSFTTLCLLMSLPAKGHGIHMHAWDWGPTAQVLLRSRHRHPDKHWFRKFTVLEDGCRKGKRTDHSKGTNSFF